MSFFSWGKKESSVKKSSSGYSGNLRFISTKDYERLLDGTDEAFRNYFFAIYHCDPDEESGIRGLRNQLYVQYPNMATKVERYFILAGEAAYQALANYHEACIAAATLPEEYRDYMKNRLVAIK